MGLCSLLLALFGIGAIGTFKANQKSADSDQKRSRWLKFSVYFALVFGQLYLISIEFFDWIVSAVIILGIWEIVKVAKSWKTGTIGLLVFGILAFGFWNFFGSGNGIFQQFIFVSVVAFDGLCQIGGQLFGRRKLFPKTSPAKTLEGLAIGFLGLVVCAPIIGNSVGISFDRAIGYTILIGIFALAGDWLASLYKRVNSVKDFNRIIPGHGGVLDRYDSLTFVSAAMFAIENRNRVDAEISNSIIFALVFAMLFALAETARKFGFGTEITRKFVHVFSGLACLCFPIAFQNWVSVLILCSGFCALLWASGQFEFLPSINEIGRKSFGSLLFPVSVFGCFCAFVSTDSVAYFYLPIAILSVCDPLAALCGKRWPFGKFKVGNGNKTLLGSAVFLISCFVVSAIWIGFSDASVSSLNLGHCLLLSIVATTAEAISRNGYDNLLIPASVVAFLWVAL